jgi:hypothetical protein
MCGRVQPLHPVQISRLMAATLFGNEDPIGKRPQAIGVHNGASEVVVGVAENAKNKGLTEQSEPEMYTFRRSLPDDWSGNHLVLVVDSLMPAKAWGYTRKHSSSHNSGRPPHGGAWRSDGTRCGAGDIQTD